MFVRRLADNVNVDTDGLENVGRDIEEALLATDVLEEGRLPAPDVDADDNNDRKEWVRDGRPSDVRDGAAASLTAASEARNACAANKETNRLLVGTETDAGSVDVRA